MPTPSKIYEWDDNRPPDAVVDLPNGMGSAELQGGNITVYGVVIRQVIIAAPSEVSSHSVHKVLGSTAHNVHFKAGGFLHLAFTDQGEVLLFEGHAIRADISADGTLTVAPYTGPLA